MRILIILKRWAGGVGGGVKNIKRELEQLGHSVDIIAREEDLNVSFLKSLLILRRKTKQLMKKNNYDIIYTQDWSLALPLLFPYSIYKRKHFCMFHGNQFGPLRMFQNLVGFIMGEHLLVMAPSLKRRFPKANINYCGVSMELFQPLNQQRKYLGWIDKGTETITKEEIDSVAKAVGMPLLVAKGIPYEKMNEFYNKCKVFVSLPPTSAGFQASWLEAMQAGVPIVIGSENGSGEIQPFDKINLNYDKLEQIKHFITNPSKTNYLKWLKENDFTWTRHAGKLIEIFSNK